jgi:hypothetical protein
MGTEYYQNCWINEATHIIHLEEAMNANSVLVENILKSGELDEGE